MSVAALTVVIVTAPQPDLRAHLEGIQVGLDTIGEPLHQTTFVVVDLETTGGSPEHSAITEIGAVKTRGGEVIGEFQTLVDPGSPIPPMIVALTGITDAMVVAAPRIEQVLPSFLEFLGDAVLVAHNARFDLGFLKAACKAHGYRWPGNEVVDTLVLARRATTKEEAPNKKLSTLAHVFGSSVTPNHRALEDARATSHVLHGMLERLARWGITHREDLDSLRNPLPEKLRKKSTMADKMPRLPGVYVFRGPDGERLYVGTSVNLRSRVKSYFTRGEQRRSVRDMLELAVDVDAHVCATDLEAKVVEVRMIHQYRPRYNRRSARPERTVWLTLTQERFPRLSVTRSLDGKQALVGPMRGAGDAAVAIEAIQHAMGVRTCTTRLPVTPRAGARACLLMDLGRCSAPCVRGVESGYHDTEAAVRHALEVDPSPVVAALSQAIADYADRLEFERAAELRDGIGALVEGSMRAQRLRALHGVKLIAARRQGNAFDVVSIVDGVLCGSARVSQGVWAAAHALSQQWDEAPSTASVEERELIARWLDQDRVRLVMVEGEWAQPLVGAGRHRSWVTARSDDRAGIADVLRDQVVR